MSKNIGDLLFNKVVDYSNIANEHSKAIEQLRIENKMLKCYILNLQHRSGIGWGKGIGEGVYCVEYDIIHSRLVIEGRLPHSYEHDAYSKCIELNHKLINS